MFCSGSSANIDLLMPDRHMDLRFNISDMDSLASGRQPGELLNYLNNLENYLTSNDSDVTQPAPPLRVFHDGCEYVLATNASVRQCTESPSWDSYPETAVTSESILDLETGHYSAVCVVRSSHVTQVFSL
ncbi:hypothetical protein BJV78DRAFT_1116381 [Lactifluus subvellereus]|nr:hypothetical protein BJV78DRAFT_1116381 [Lactifluus subvellereus]